MLIYSAVGVKLSLWQTHLQKLIGNEMKRKIGFFGLMKSFESAQTSFEEMSGGGIKATIHHDVMKNVKVKIVS